MIHHPRTRILLVLAGVTILVALPWVVEFLASPITTWVILLGGGAAFVLFGPWVPTSRRSAPAGARPEVARARLSHPAGSAMRERRPDHRLPRR